MRTILTIIGLVFTCCEGERVPNLTPPTRLDVIMRPDGGQLARCEHVGGELIYTPWLPDAIAWTCEGIDY